MSGSGVPREKFSLVICTPFYEVKAYSPYIVNLINSLDLLKQSGIEWQWKQLAGDSYVHRAKNLLIHDFLKTDFTHLMMIDSDLAWTTEDFSRLVMAAIAGAEIVGGAFPNKNAWENYGVNLTYQNGQPVIGEAAGVRLLQVDAMPGGFLIYSRKAIERARPALREIRYEVDGEKVLECFRCDIQDDDLFIGEDFYFQKKFREMGGQVWLDPKVSLQHWGVKAWEGCFWNKFLRDHPQHRQSRVPDMVIHDYRFTDLEQPLDFKVAAKVLREGYAKLKPLGTCWLSAGTALGFWRGNDFIPGDTDIDLAIIGYEDIDKEIKAAFADWELIRTGYCKGKPMQIAYRKYGVIFDIFIHWKVEDNYYNFSQLGITKMAVGLYDNAKEYSTKYGPFPLPHPPEVYLETRYGPDWRTPKDEKPRFE